MGCRFPYLAAAQVFECLGGKRVVHQINPSRRNESGDESPHSKDEKVELSAVSECFVCYFASYVDPGFSKAPPCQFILTA